jgi:oxaloacetate decarboxylase
MSLSPSPRTRLKKLLEGDRCIYPATVFDAISGRIASDLGFEAGMLGGSVAAMAVLGAPDNTVITLTELADLTRRITRASDLPVIVDADHGYGGVLNVHRTVEEIEHAGAAAVTIEDTDLPQRFGETKHSLISIQEAEAKISAAIEAVKDDSFLVIGRTAAASIADIDEAIARGKAMEAAGADALFFSGITHAEQLDTLARHLRGPFVLGGVGKAICDQKYLASRNVRVALRGHHAYTATIQAAYSTLFRLHNGAAPEDLTDQPSEQVLRQLRRELAL